MKQIVTELKYILSKLTYGPEPLEDVKCSVPWAETAHRAIFRGCGGIMVQTKAVPLSIPENFGPILTRNVLSSAVFTLLENEFPKNASVWAILPDDGVFRKIPKEPAFLSLVLFLPEENCSITKLTEPVEHVTDVCRTLCQNNTSETFRSPVTVSLTLSLHQFTTIGMAELKRQLRKAVIDKIEETQPLNPVITNLQLTEKETVTITAKTGGIS